MAKTKPVASTEPKVLIDNKAVPVDKTVLTFGFKSIKRATPEVATWVFRAVLYTVAIAALASRLLSFIPAEVGDLVNKYGLEIVALVHALTKMFGLKVEGPQS